MAGILPSALDVLDELALGRHDEAEHEKLKQCTPKNQNYLSKYKDTVIYTESERNEGEV